MNNPKIRRVIAPEGVYWLLGDKLTEPVAVFTDKQVDGLLEQIALERRRAVHAGIVPVGAEKS